MTDQLESEKLFNYDYQCDWCGHEYSRRRTIALHALEKKECPRCGSSKVALLTPATAFRQRETADTAPEVRMM